MSLIHIEKHQNLGPELLAKIIGLEKEIFLKPYKEDKLLSKTKDKELMILLAYKNGSLAGYKIGYTINPQVFYSWIGGVLPRQRGQGIASALMKEQHQLLKTMGFIKVKTKTRNQFRKMLLLNIKTGFDIVDTYQAPAEMRIVLEKTL